MATDTHAAPSAPSAQHVEPGIPGLAPHRQTLGRTVVKWITSTDHKTIGYLYLISSFIFFMIAGLMALVIRAELFSPGIDIVQSKEQYNQLFTMHGTIMLLLFATPLDRKSTRLNSSHANISYAVFCLKKKKQKNKKFIINKKE